MEALQRVEAPQATEALAAHHREKLEVESGISPEDIAERGYYTATDPAELVKLGFAEYQAQVPALVIPVWGVDGKFKFCRIRPDDPRPDMTRPGKVVKYEQPQNTGLVLDVPRRCQPYLTDTSRALWIVEGERKADSLASRGEVAVAVLGVWAWKRDGLLLPDWDQVWTIGREINIAFDSDAHRKYEVLLARQRLAAAMERRAGRDG